MSDIESDLHRRDFTINTLAIRLDGEHYGELLNVCNGLQDLRKGLIRTLHNRSFIDDPTRLFRAVRFEQRLDFDLESDTLRQFREQSYGVALLTGQRIWHELKLYCDEPNPEDDFARITQYGIAEKIHEKLVWNNSIEAECIRFRETIPDDFWQDHCEIDFELVEAEGLLWIWISTLPLFAITEISERLLLPKKSLICIESLAALREQFPELSHNAPSEITFFLEKLPIETLYCYAMFCSEDEKQALKNFIEIWQKIHPITTGSELLEMGMKPGPEMKNLLLLLRAETIDAGLQPEDEAEWIKSCLARGL